MPIKQMIVLSMLFAAWTSHAAILYVDKDNTTNCNGTTSQPYCTIQQAFNVVNPGDSILIRDSATPYDGHFSLQRSGTAGNFITIGPDVGHNPIITYSAGYTQNEAAMQIRQVNYIIVQNLTFSGTGINTAKRGLSAEWVSGNPAMHDIQFIGNTFKDWMGPASNAVGDNIDNGAMFIDGAYCTTVPGTSCPVVMYNVTIANNTFDGNRGYSIFTRGITGTTIQNNMFKNMSCFGGNGPYLVAGGIKMLGFGGGFLIKGNTFRDWVPLDSCGLNPASYTYAISTALWTDVGPGSPGTSVLEENIVFNNNQGNGNDVGRTSNGFFIEASSWGWTVRNNLLYNIGVTGIRQRGYDDTNAATWTQPPNEYVNNTLYNIALNGMQIATGKAVIRNNIIHHIGSCSLHFDGTDSGVHTINNNLYWDNAGGVKVGEWGFTGVKNFAAWKTACGCDANSLNVNPQFVNVTAGSENFQLQATSQALNTGASLANVSSSLNGLSRPQGSGYDIGAYEMAVASPTPVACWAFDSSGADSTGLGHTATLVGGASYGPGRIGQAVVLDGTSGYVSVASAPDLSITGDFSVDFWVNMTLPTVGGTKDIFDREDTAGLFNAPYKLKVVNPAGTARYVFYHHNDPGDSSSTFTFTGFAVPATTWHHVVITRNNTTQVLTLWVNGALAQLLTSCDGCGTGWTDNPGANSVNMTIGVNRSLVSTRFLQGSLDELCLYPYVLTSADIAARYARGAGELTPPVLTRKVK